MESQKLLAAGWERLGARLSELQGLSIDREAYPLAPDSLLVGDESGMPESVSVAAVVRSLLDSAVDDLVSAFALATEAKRLSPVGIPTLVRGAIELAGLGMWVLAGNERLGRQERAIRIAYDSFVNASKFFEELSKNVAVPQSVRDDAAKGAVYNKSCCSTLLEGAARGGHKKNKVSARLNRTSALKEVDVARETDFFSKWQLCSGFAHGLAWASQVFHTQVHVHSMEGGGLLTGRTLEEDRAQAILNWGLHAVEELTGTFAAGRQSLPGPMRDCQLSPAQREKSLRKLWLEGSVKVEFKLNSVRRRVRCSSRRGAEWGLDNLVALCVRSRHVLRGALVQ
ncbi:hypothetical protein [Arthrobacter psychrolactophilus]